MIIATLSSIAMNRLLRMISFTSSPLLQERNSTLASLFPTNQSYVNPGRFDFRRLLLIALLCQSPKDEQASTKNTSSFFKRLVSSRFAILTILISKGQAHSVLDGRQAAGQ